MLYWSWILLHLSKKNLEVNKTKTEEYTIKRNGQMDWKWCKYLGSLLDLQKYVKRRKALTIATYNKLRNILENRSTSMKTKIRILKVYIESVFLYSSELWTLTKLLVKGIDIFQWGVIKKIFNIHWQDKIMNVELYRSVAVYEYVNWHICPWHSFVGGYIHIYGNCNGLLWHLGVVRYVLLKPLLVLSVPLYPLVVPF